MSIEERVERLERGTRFWRRLALLLLVLVFVIVALESVKSERPSSLEARSLIIRGPKGRVRMKIHCDSDGQVEQTFFDGEGRILADLGQAVGGAYLRLRDPSQENEFFALAGGGQVYLHMWDAQGTPRISAQVHPKGSSHMTMCDENSQRRLVVGRPIYLDLDRGAEPGNAEGSLRLFDAKGDVIWQAPEKK